jgi:hypothetical protein
MGSYPLDFEMKEAGMRKVIAIIIVTMLVSPTLWARGAYKWVDDNGVVHYSDRMRGDEVSVINVKVKQPAAQSSADKAESADKASANDKVAAAGGGSGSAAGDKELRRKNCAKARKQLETNQRLSRMYRIVDGERQYLSEKERGAVIKRSREAVNYWCQ